MEFIWLPKYHTHCFKHQAESPEICPDFIEQVLEYGSPSRIYPDKNYPHRTIFEGYHPPGHGRKPRPYRVVFEVAETYEIVPVACWRIKDRDFRKESPQQAPANSQKTDTPSSPAALKKR
ncbi:MAG: hypothetical protein P4L36_18090 [Holophaga sp.]|nr:hypothetical protein [Holophaga sp.]